LHLAGFVTLGLCVVLGSLVSQTRDGGLVFDAADNAEGCVAGPASVTYHKHNAPESLAVRLTISDEFTYADTG
jgi:hypothetical protein